MKQPDSPKMLPRMEFLNSLPKKRMSAGAIFRNDANEVLFVKPGYRETWLVPGGVIDADESPKQACEREILEEIGLKVEVSNLLVTVYTHSRLNETESISFMFDGGLLSQAQLDAIHYNDTEIEDHKFMTLEEAKPLITEGFALTIENALKAFQESRCIYFEKDMR